MGLDVYITRIEEICRAMFSKNKFIDFRFFYMNFNYLIFLREVTNSYLCDHPFEEGADGKGTSPVDLSKDR